MRAGHVNLTHSERHAVTLHRRAQRTPGPPPWAGARWASESKNAAWHQLHLSTTLRSVELFAVIHPQTPKLQTVRITARASSARSCGECSDVRVDSTLVWIQRQCHAGVEQPPAREDAPGWRANVASN
jgi:hypothetical protein